MNGYIAFCKGKRLELHADTLYKAQQEAARQFKCKPYQVAVMMAEQNGQPVIHDTAEL